MSDKRATAEALRKKSYHRKTMNVKEKECKHGIMPSSDCEECEEQEIRKSEREKCEKEKTCMIHQKEKTLCVDCFKYKVIESERAIKRGLEQ